MSRRRRLVREPGRLRKTVEVLVSGLFGMAVVGVVLVVLQNGSATAPGPIPSTSVTGRTFPTGGTDSGLVIVRSATTGTPSVPGAVYSAGTGTVPSSTAGGQGAQGAQQTGQTEPVSRTPSSGSQSTASSGASSGASSSASPTPSASSSGGGLLGVVGGLVGGVLGLL